MPSSAVKASRASRAFIRTSWKRSRKTSRISSAAARGAATRRSEKYSTSCPLGSPPARPVSPQKREDATPPREELEASRPTPQDPAGRHEEQRGGHRSAGGAQDGAPAARGEGSFRTCAQR